MTLAAETLHIEGRLDAGLPRSGEMPLVLTPSGRPLILRDLSVDGLTHEANPSHIALPSGTRRFSFDIPIEPTLIDKEANLAHGYVSSSGDRAAFSLDSLPTLDRRLLPIPVSLEADGLATEPLARGVIIAGEGWRWWRGDLIDGVIAPEVDQERADEMLATISAAMEELAKVGLPFPLRKPLALILPENPDVALLDLQLAPEKEVYVVECAPGAISVQVLRDVARSAVRRLAAVRPSNERGVWWSMEVYLGAALAGRLGLALSAERLAAARSSYESIRPVRITLARFGESESDLSWISREVAGPYIWERFLTGLGSPESATWERLGRLISVAAAAPDRELSELDLGLPRSVLQDMVTEHFEQSRFFGPAAGRTPGRFPIACKAESRPRIGHLSRVGVLFSALGMGFLDNCGCALNQGGGLPRQMTMVARRRASRSDLVVLDLGDALAPPFSKQFRGTEQNRMALRLLSEMHYDALVPGMAELYSGPDWITSEARHLDLPYVAANLRSSRTREPLFPARRVLHREGRRIVIIGLCEPPWSRYRWDAIAKLVLSRYELTPALEALQHEIADVLPEDLCVVAGSILPETARALLERSEWSDRIDLCLTNSWNISHVLDQDSSESEMVVMTLPELGLYGDALYAYPVLERFGLTELLIDVDGHGRVLGGSATGLQLTPAVPRAPRGEELLLEFAHQQAGDRSTWLPTPLAGLPEERSGARYIGAEACAACHPAQKSSWLATRHSKAMTTLAARGRDFDPACLRCHTTGFHLESGYLPGAPGRRLLEGVQCEVCHGPGSAHAASPGQRGLVRSGAPSEVLCLMCHDADNSPGFAFEEALPLVLHRMDR